MHFTPDHLRNLLAETLLANSREAICAFDRDGGYLSFNQQHALIMRNGYDVTISEGMHWEDFMKDSDALERIRQSRERALSGESFSYFMNLPDAHGAMIRLELTYAPLPDEQGRIVGYYVVASDVTEHYHREGLLRKVKLSELRLKKLREAEVAKLVEERHRRQEELLLATVRSLESERKRIASEMHDDLGPGLSRISSLLQVLLAANDLTEEKSASLEKALQNANEVQRSISEIIWSMDPSRNTLDQLIAYLRYQALEYLDGSNVRLKVNTPKNIPTRSIDGSTRRNLLLIIKESLNNILKHSGATDASLEIRIEDATDEKPTTLLRIILSDNGIGFDEQQLPPFRNGLTNLRNRATSIGGTLEITSRKNEGTLLDLIVRIKD